MDYPTALVNNVKKVIGSIKDLILLGVLENEKQIRDWITKRWLTGKTPNGDLIGFYQGYDYAEFKNVMNSFAGLGHVDLTLTGALGKGIRVNPISKDKFEIFSTDWKYNDIAEKYGELNFNISEPEKKMLYSKIVMVIMQEIDKAYA